MVESRKSKSLEEGIVLGGVPRHQHHIELGGGDCAFDLIGLSGHELNALQLAGAFIEPLCTIVQGVDEIRRYQRNDYGYREYCPVGD